MDSLFRATEKKSLRPICRLGLELGMLAALISPASAQYAQWTQKTNIVLNTTATGANVTSDVKGFPIGINLNSTNFNFSQAKNNGDDLRFSMGTTPLPYEIESWDAAGQKAAVWVKADVKGNDKTQAITMYWGNSAATSESDGKKVFPKAEGWASVWHLAEKGSTVDGAYKDASENAAHGHGINISGDATGAGRIGNAVNLTVARKEYIRIENSQNNPIYQLNTNATYSIWANATSHKTSYQGIFTKGETGFRIHYYGLPEWPDNTDPVAGQKNITEVCLDPNDRCPLKGGNATAWKGTDVKPGTWFHLVLVVNATKANYYINGVLEAQDNGGALTSGAEPLAIGNNADRSRSYDGLLDEARVQSVVRDLNWVKLDYESQKPDGKFLEFGNVSTGLGKPASLAQANPGAAATVKRYDALGNLVVTLHSAGDRRADLAELQRLSGPGLFFDKLISDDGEVVTRLQAIIR